MSSIRIQSATQTWDADQPRSFVIGRDETCDIVAREPGVSRRHAEIRAVGDVWEVVDLGSSAGTFVNGRQVTQAQFTGTSSVRVGGPTSGHDLTVTVVSAAPAAPAPPAGAAAPPPAAATAMVDRPAAPFPPQAPVAPGLDMTVAAGQRSRRCPRGPRIPGLLLRPGLLVRLRSGDKQFPAGLAGRIGRDPRSRSSPRPVGLAAPRHGRGRPDGWWRSTGRPPARSSPVNASCRCGSRSRPRSASATDRGLRA